MGEAVVIDLGKRGVLFALLKGPKFGEDYHYMVLYDALPSGAGGHSPTGIEYYSNLKDAKATLTFEQYPMLVTFKDLNDPKTVTPALEVKPLGSNPRHGFKIEANHFEELFGKGVKLQQITIEMTTEPVTWGLDTYLNWLASLKGGYLHGGPTSRVSPLGLHGGNFQRR